MGRELELSTAYARLILQSGVAPAAQLLQGVPVSADAIVDREFIGLDAHAILFRNYNRLVADRAWTVRLGAQFNIGVHGSLGFAALSAPTLGEAMDVLGSLSASRSNAIGLHTDATPSHYILRLSDFTDENDIATWLAEIILKMVETFLGTILGHPVGENVLISFRHDPPAPPEVLTDHYDAKVTFAGEFNSLSVPLAWRHFPSPLHDETVYRANVIRCRELIAAREGAGTVAEAVRNRLRLHFDGQILQPEDRPVPTLERMADDMHTTPRTLIRRLNAENASFKAILEAMRKEYAQSMLQDARLTVADIATTLGYSEPANFGRAFRRWHGASPAAWRRCSSRGVS